MHSPHEGLIVLEDAALTLDSVKAKPTAAGGK
jgi:hypothetical protein